jgi:hypothetical protein
MSMDTDEAALRREIIAGLERTIWTPGDGVRDLDRVEAVQLLGRFRDPAAEAALLRVLREGMEHIRPAPLGRLLRDTALDTLLRSTMLPRAVTDRALARYYNFGARLLRGRLERNVIYDDIPLLVRHGRGGLVLRAYVLPLVGGLIALVVLAVVLAGGLLAGNELLGAALGLVFFIAFGLGLFNLHQVGLVLLLAAWGRRWPLPWLPRAGSKAATAAVLAVIAFVLGLYAALRLLFLVARGYNDAGGREVAGYLLLLPLLALPCYMLAHDLEVAPPAAGGTARRGPAVALRWASGFIYVIFVLDAYGLTWIQQARAGFRSFGGDLDVLMGMLLWLLYLVLAPLPVLLLLSALGRLTRTRAGGRPAAEAS